MLGGAPRGVIEQLKELAQLRDAGILTDDEFAAQKAKLLA
jgi:Short C-terminal domain